MKGQCEISRRRLLASSAGAVAAGLLAGCGETSPAESDGGDSSPQDTPTETPDSTTENTDDGDAVDTDDGSGGLDLREANVVDVAFEGGGQYTFDVTLHHDDNGEEGYANWWQVETLDGTQLGRRTLLHAHSRQPFTRSETIEIPGDTSCVVVRGHDQTHGYGGRAMLVDLASGATQSVEQGSDRQPVDPSDCP
jgi:hypothetical protein